MNPNFIGLYAGAVAAAVYFSFCFFRYRKVPTLNQVVVVSLACAGAVAGIYLGYLSLVANDDELGKLADQRLVVFLGALAVVWTATESIATSIKSARPSEAKTVDPP
ncbi:MAG: hypothetical protein KF800_13765 [Lysobacter sp.]|nr:hypothetical protein [Lysobacter sp.]